MPKIIMICEFCKKEFNTYVGRHKGFCSKACSNNYRTLHKIRRGGPVKKLPDIKFCEFCKKEFKPKKIQQRFCNNICSSQDPLVYKAKQEAGFKNKGKKRTEEQRKKMSKSASKREAKSVYTKGIGGKRKDIDFYVRSSWEANIARLLKFLNINFSYETKTFELENGKYHYRPDFKIEENYLEVKGWWDDKSKLLKELMKKEYPEIYIIYISEKEYKLLQEEFKDKIKGWEYGKRRKCGQ